MLNLEGVKKGDFCFASMTGEVDPQRSWAIAWVCHIYENEHTGDCQFLMGEKNLKPFRPDFILPFARKITHKEGREIHRQLKPRRLFDEIWRFLIEEHRKLKNIDEAP